LCWSVTGADDYAPVAASTTTRLATPAPVAWPELRYSRDVHLQDGLRAALRKTGLARYAQEQKLAVALVDITVLDQPRVATINAHHMMYAASLPKIAILLGAFQKSADGLLEMDDETVGLLTRMIRNSSNSAATTMLERVGFDYVAQTLQSDRYALYDHDMNGGLWVGKPYAKAGAYKRDPLYNLSHAATPFEVARFYYLLETGRLVDPQASRSMREMLSEPAVRHKFVLGLETHRPGSKIFRKSGTWRTYHADSAIVERDGRRYIAVAMANHPSGGAWLSKLIVAMDDLIFSPENVAHDHMEDHSEPVELPAKAVTASRS
jgi:beta-lactamase class A